MDDRICRWNNNFNIVTHCQYLNDPDGYCYLYGDSCGWDLEGWERCQECIDDKGSKIFE
jgi:hypothetical protein